MMRRFGLEPKQKKKKSSEVCSLNVNNSQTTHSAISQNASSTSGQIFQTRRLSEAVCDMCLFLCAAAACTSLKETSSDKRSTGVPVMEGKSGGWGGRLCQL